MPAADSIPALPAAAMARLDRLLVDELGFDVLQLMESAGSAVAAEARARLPDGDARDRRVLVLAGSGGNGGDGLVAARLLRSWGAQVDVILSHDPAGLRGPAAHQHEILVRLGQPPAGPPPADAPIALPPADLLIDALLGFGLAGPPSGVSAAFIRAANAHGAPILAVDLPSGLDATTGVPYAPCVRAAVTVTLALPKTGLVLPSARPVVGDLVLADIGVPLAAYRRLGFAIPPLFHRSSRIALSWPRPASDP
ncbi:MAG TPA: NAD(P)H-hydrate epimerase [Thermomicrobiales bacterium]|nr:NAD(P)H-hydrate epimerase [Thermomicrobiales bacterium]